MIWQYVYLELFVDFVYCFLAVTTNFVKKSLKSDKEAGERRHFTSLWLFHVKFTYISRTTEVRLALIFEYLFLLLSAVILEGRFMWQSR